MDKTMQNYKKNEKKTNRSNVILPLLFTIFFEYVFSISVRRRASLLRRP